MLSHAQRHPALPARVGAKNKASANIVGPLDSQNRPLQKLNMKSGPSPMLQYRIKWNLACAFVMGWLVAGWGVGGGGTVVGRGSWMALPTSKLSAKVFVCNESSDKQKGSGKLAAKPKPRPQAQLAPVVSPRVVGLRKGGGSTAGEHCG